MIKQKIIFSIIFTIILTSLSAQDSVNNYDENGERHGIWQKNYPNTNQLRYEGQFNHGKEIDTFKYYKLKQKKSVLSAIKVFNPNNNTSDVTFMASNGRVVSKGQMNGKNFIGKWVYFHKKSSDIMITEHYNENGTLEGTRTVFFISGKEAEIVEYKNGKQNGLSKIYSESGKLLQSSVYSDDKLNGLTTYFDVGDVVRAKGNFKNNIKTGVWEYYKDAVLVKKVDHDTDTVLFKKQ